MLKAIDMEWLKTALLVVTAVIGWFIANYLTACRERKSEWRKLALSAVKDIELIEKKAIKYHKCKNRDIGMEEDIVRSLERLQEKISLLQNNLRGITNFTFIKFRQAITLRNFQTNTFTPQQPNSPILKSIMAHATGVITMLYTAN